MNGDPGFCLAAWSDQFSSWVSVAVFRERARISIWPAALRCSAVLSRLFRWRPSMMRTRKGGRCEAAAAVCALVVHPKGDPNS